MQLDTGTGQSAFLVIWATAAGLLVNTGPSYYNNIRVFIWNNPEQDNIIRAIFQIFSWQISLDRSPWRTTMQWDHCCYSAEERLRSALSSGDNCQSGVNIKLSSLSTSLSLSLAGLCWSRKNSLFPAVFDLHYKCGDYWKPQFRK